MYYILKYGARPQTIRPLRHSCYHINRAIGITIEACYERIQTPRDNEQRPPLENRMLGATDFGDRITP